MSENAMLHGVDDTNTLSSPKVKWIPVKVDPNGNLKISLGTNIAGERNSSSAVNSYLVTQREWNVYNYNPHTSAAVGTLTAGAVGNTEVLISAVPVYIGGIIWASDCAAGSLYWYDKAATASAGIPHPFVYNANFPILWLDGLKTTTGLTVVGTVAGISCDILWKSV